MTNNKMIIERLDEQGWNRVESMMSLSVGDVFRMKYPQDETLRIDDHGNDVFVVEDPPYMVEDNNAGVHAKPFIDYTG